MIEHLKQRSLQSSVSLRGVALHSGAQVTLRLRPAEANTGIVFHRTDIGGPGIPAQAQYITDTARATKLGRGRASVGTVEHLLSALRGLGLDNVHVDVDGPELPVLDGSALPYVQLIRRAGVRVQHPLKRVAVLREPLSVGDDSRYARLLPANHFSASSAITFDHPVIGSQQIDLDWRNASYEQDLAPARTFAFFREVQWLRSQGLARGGSLDNAIVVDEDKVLNPSGLRFADEFVRHKLLDAIGDLALTGMHLVARYESARSGHELHRQLTQLFLDSPEAWVEVDPCGGEYFEPSALVQVDWSRQAADAA